MTQQPRRHRISSLQWLLRHSAGQSAPGSSREERGIALLLALLIGMLLIAAATGLLIRQLMARKLGASESYQQLAETAAVNGFNRILGRLNNNSPDDYLGFLYAVNNREKAGEPGIPKPGYQWNLFATDAPPVLPQLCTNTSALLSNGAINWDPLEETPLSLPSDGDTYAGTLRDDGRDDGIKTYYRLRGYAKPSGEGVFEVEGLVRREGTGEGEELSRALLTRTLNVSAMVLTPEDWAVIAGNYLNLGSSSIAGASTESKGKIVWNVSSDANFRNPSSNCANASYLKTLPGLSFSGSDTSIESAIARDLWPVLQGSIPLTSYDKGKTIDMMPASTSKVRIWSFDDSGDSASGCRDSVVCTRAHDSTSTSVPAVSKTLDNSNGRWTVAIDADDICAAKNSTNTVCHLFVEHINLSNTNVRFRTLGSAIEAVVLHLELPYNSAVASDLSGRIQLDGNSSLCLTSTSGSSCDVSQPERLVISSSTGPQPSQCSSITSKPYVLQIAGDALPAALIHLPKASLSLSAEAQMAGIVWAHDICANGHGLQLSTEVGGTPVIASAQQFWGWEPENGYGRQVLRGIRGTGLDIFKRF